MKSKANQTNTNKDTDEKDNYLIKLHFEQRGNPSNTGGQNLRTIRTYQCKYSVTSAAKQVKIVRANVAMLCKCET